MKNQFIVFEGPDHSGKSLAVKLLKEYMKKKHPDTYEKTMFTREPGGSGLSTCESIRKLLLNPKNTMTDLTEAYLYAASRAEHCQTIKEWMMNGHNVLCERFVYSSYIYQGIGKGLGTRKVMEINESALDELEPNMIIYFKIDFETYKQRKGLIKELDRLELNEENFFKRIIDGYDELMQRYQYFYNVVTIDASKSIEEVQADIIKALQL